MPKMMLVMAVASERELTVVMVPQITGIPQWSDTPSLSVSRGRSEK